jgi:hypothetical protein
MHGSKRRREETSASRQRRAARAPLADPTGIRLDRLTHTQRRVLELLQIPLPWPEQGQVALANCGRRG